MKRFRFSLESVLILREKTLQDAQKSLALITGVYNRQNDVLNEMTFELQRLRTESEKYLEDTNCNPSLVANYNSFSLKLANDIKLQGKIIEKTRQDLLRQQEMTKKAYIAVKSLENLKEKQKERYNHEVLAEEYKEIDDIVNSKRI